MLKKLEDIGQSFRAYLQTPEIVYSVVLIVLIPVLIVVNSIFLIDQFSSVINGQAQDKAADSARLLAQSLPSKDYQLIQARIDEAVSSSDKYFLRLDYWTKDPKGEAFSLAASTSKDQVGKVIRPQADAPTEEDDPRSFTQLNLSWAERHDIAVESVEQGQAGYLVSILSIDPISRERLGVISAFVSSEQVGSLLDNAYLRSASLLTITVIITLVLLFLRSRIYRYTSLFKKLQEVDQTKDEFISIASHELRSPLASIRGSLELLLDEHDLSTPDKQKLLRNAEKSTEQLTSLVADLLDVSRLEQGRIEIRPENLDIGKFIGPVVDDMAVLAKEKHISLSYQPPTVSIMVSADKDKLRQILVNLIGNALKYTQRGTVNVAIETDRDMVEVFVRDTGVGMSPEDRAKLFSKFYRIRNKQTAEISGTGLGLWITKKLVELMGGQIFVDSIEGSGTQVKFTLPKA